MGKKPLKVMVVDDSAFMRRFIGDIIEGDSELQLVGTARNGEDALKKRELYRPDVIALDVDMPGMDGLATLKRLMSTDPLPVVMVSSHTQQGSDVTMEALLAGAVDFVTKPSLSRGESAEEIKKLLPSKIKAAARARVAARPFLAAGAAALAEAVADPAAEKRGPHALRPARLVVAIASSTGGPRALEEVMRGFPADIPAAVFITQHMPAGFTEALARRLDRVSQLKVRESAGGEMIMEGQAYLAPGGYHLIVDESATIVLSTAEAVQFVRPSADVMMNSLVELYKSAVLGVVLTGMGRDGADGMARIKEAGGMTVVQEPSSAVIPSMPLAIINKGLADVVVPLERIAETVTEMLRQLRY